MFYAPVEIRLRTAIHAHANPRVRGAPRARAIPRVWSVLLGTEGADTSATGVYIEACKRYLRDVRIAVQHADLDCVAGGERGSNL